MATIRCPAPSGALRRSAAERDWLAAQHLSTSRSRHGRRPGLRGCRSPRVAELSPAREPGSALETAGQLRKRCDAANDEYATGCLPV